MRLILALVAFVALVHPHDHTPGLRTLAEMVSRKGV